MTVASDVTNPLLGPDGATRIYGPQKGMREEDFAKADACFNRPAMITAETIGTDFAITPGAGAAGGLGFGLMAFAGATLRSGFDVFSNSTGLESRIAKAELVITAEGAIDEQTLMGKGTGQVAQLCERLAKPCVAWRTTCAWPSGEGICGNRFINWQQSCRTWPLSRNQWQTPPTASSAWPSAWLKTYLLRRANEKSGDRASTLGQFASAGVVAAKALGHGGHCQCSKGITRKDLTLIGNRLDTRRPVNVRTVIGILPDQGIVTAINRAGVEANPDVQLSSQANLGPVDVPDEVLDDKRSSASVLDVFEHCTDGVSPCVDTPAALKSP